MPASRLDRFERQIAINGAMQFWQRVVGNTTTVNTATPLAGWAADRIKYGTSGGTTKHFSIVRSTDVPSINGYVFPYSYQFSCLTAIGAPAAGDVVNPFQYIVEGNDYRYLHARNMFLGFWIKITSPASFPLSVPVSFSNNSTRSYVTSFTVNASGVWQFIPVQVLLDSAGVWAFDTSAGLKITIAASTGTTSQGAQNLWQTGANEFFSSSGLFNSMSHNTNVIRITGLQIYSLGNEANALAGFDGQEYPIISVGEELRRCQRYYEKSYNLDVVPATGSSGGQAIFNNNDSAGSRNPFFYVGYAVNKRVAVTPTIYNATTGASPGARGSDANDYVVDQIIGGEHGLMGRIIGLSALTSASLHFTADAEI